MFLPRVRFFLFIGLIGLGASMQAHAQFQQAIVFFDSLRLTASPATIDAGESATISFQGRIVQAGCDVCIFSNTFTDQGLVEGPSNVQQPFFTILSGDGDSFSGRGTSGSVTFTYETPGVYQPSVSGTLLYTRAYRLTRLSTGQLIESGVDSFTGGFTPSTTSITVLAVPEPQSGALLAAGLVLLVLSMRKRVSSALATATTQEALT